MGVFNLEQEPLPEKTNEDNGKLDLSNLRSLKIGAGSQIIVMDKEGQRFGSHLFDDAKAYIKTDGSFKFKNSSGDVLIDSNDANGDFINVINQALNTSSKKILQDFTFEETDYAGAFKTGDITWNATTGAVTGGTGSLLNSRGLIIAESGVAKVTLVPGLLSIDGDIIATGITADHITTGTLSADRIASGSISDAKLGSTVISGGKIITSLLTADNIQAGTLSGRTVKANNGSGADVWMSNSGVIYFRYANDNQAIFYCDTSGNLIIDADNSITLLSDGAGDDITISAGEDLGFIARDLTAVCSRNAGITCDDWIVTFNDDNDGSECYWVDGATDNTRMRLDEDGNLYIDDLYNYGADFAEMFESVDGKEIQPGVSVVLEGEKIRKAKNNETPIGVISATANVIGNAGGTDAGCEWGGKYLVDEFGRTVKEKAEFWFIKKESIRERRQRIEKGLPIKGWSDRMKPPKNAVKKVAERNKLNPRWNPNRKYVERKDRPEWNTVGMVGRVRILKGQPTAPTWIKLKDISDTVEEWLIK